MKINDLIYTKDSTRFFEISAVILTGVFKFLMVNILNIRFFFIAATIIFWLSYLTFRFRRDKNTLINWGFTSKNIGRSFLWISVVSLIYIASILIYGNYTQQLILSKNLLIVLLTYPIWGITQQFMIMSLIVGNLKDLKCCKINTGVIVLVNATIFACVHLPSLPLVIITFTLAVFYSIIYLRYRNLWALGIYHGIIGGLFYYVILGKDVLMDFIRQLGIG